MCYFDSKHYCPVWRGMVGFKANQFSPDESNCRHGDFHQVKSSLLKREWGTSKVNIHIEGFEEIKGVINMEIIFLFYFHGKNRTGVERLALVKEGIAVTLMVSCQGPKKQWQ